MHGPMVEYALYLLMAALTTLQPAAPPKPGVTTPGVRIPIERLVPDAVFDVPGAPDWIVPDEAVWISNKPKNSVSRLDPKTNLVSAVVATGQGPCSGLATGFGSLWVPNCGDHTIARVDLESGAITATIPTGIGSSEGSIATGAGSVWLITDAKGTLARFDPATNAIVAEIYVAPGSYGLAFGEDAVWVTSTERSTVARVDPHKLGRLQLELMSVDRAGPVRVGRWRVDGVRTTGNAILRRPSAAGD